jgi:hypothetical protein
MFQIFFSYKDIATNSFRPCQTLTGLRGAIQEDTNMLASDHRTQNQMLLVGTLPFYT